jgi:ribosome-binding protein aMBF1 (putative translation factor)
MLPCAFCNGRTSVVCTELHPDGHHRWRRCEACGKTTRTLETYLHGRHRCGPLPGAKRKPKPRAQGERNANAVLTVKDVQRLRAQAAAGASRATLAQRYGITKGHVSRIVHRRLWAHVP